MDRKQAKKVLEDEITCLSNSSCKECPLDTKDGCQNDAFVDDIRRFIEAYETGLEAIEKLEQIEELVNEWNEDIDERKSGDAYMCDIDDIIEGI